MSQDSMVHAGAHAGAAPKRPARQLFSGWALFRIGAIYGARLGTCQDRGNLMSQDSTVHAGAHAGAAPKRPVRQLFSGWALVRVGAI